MTSLFAFLHHIAAFTLFAALVVELILIREVLTVGTARRLQVADMVFGISAGVLAEKEKGETHDCAGKNSCKGKGGCKSGDNGCGGKNSCKGKGGCAVKDGKPVHK